MLVVGHKGQDQGNGGHDLGVLCVIAGLLKAGLYSDLS